jgi:hypothetical protein
MRVFYIMGNCHLSKIECFHMPGTPESERLKVTALNLWEASYLSFDRPLPGKPPKIPDRLSPFSKSRFLILRHSLYGMMGVFFPIAPAFS